MSGTKIGLTDEQTQYIDRNHEHESIRMMSDALGVLYNTTASYCRRMKYDPPTEKEMKIKKLWGLYRNHTLSQLAEMFDISLSSMRGTLIEMGVQAWDGKSVIQSEEELSRQREEEKRLAALKKERRVGEMIKSFTGYYAPIPAFSAALSDRHSSLAPKELPPDYKRPPAVYNQSGSEFLDKWNGITTTERSGKLLI